MPFNVSDEIARLSGEPAEKISIWHQGLSSSNKKLVKTEVNSRLKAADNVLGDLEPHVQHLVTASGIKLPEATPVISTSQTAPAPSSSGKGKDPIADEVTDSMINEMWTEIDNLDVSTIDVESLRIFEYQGFQPTAVQRSLMLAQKRNKITKDQFVDDILMLCSIAIIKGSINDNNIKKITLAGQKEVSRLENLYGIKRGSGRGEKPEIVTVSRVAAAFPGKIMQLIISGKVPARKFIGPLKSNTLPAFMRHQAFAAIIPAMLDESVKDFMLSIITAFSVDQSISISPYKKKKPDVVELFESQRAFLQITAESSYPPEPVRVSIFKTLVINFDDLVTCAKALNTAYPSFQIIEKDMFIQAMNKI